MTPPQKSPHNGEFPLDSHYSLGAASLGEATGSSGKQRPGHRGKAPGDRAGVPHKLPHTKTTITTPATLPGAAPIRRCPSCGIGYVMAGDPPVLAWEGTCNRCGHVEGADATAPRILCRGCGAAFPAASKTRAYCTDCAAERLRAARLGKRVRPTVTCKAEGCGTVFRADSHRFRYCEPCRVALRLESYRKSSRKRYRSRRGDPLTPQQLEDRAIGGRVGVRRAVAALGPVVCVDCGQASERHSPRQKRCPGCRRAMELQWNRERQARRRGTIHISAPTVNASVDGTMSRGA